MSVLAFPEHPTIGCLVQVGILREDGCRRWAPVRVVAAKGGAADSRSENEVTVDVTGTCTDAPLGQSEPKQQESSGRRTLERKAHIGSPPGRGEAQEPRVERLPMLAALESRSAPDYP